MKQIFLSHAWENLENGDCGHQRAIDVSLMLRNAGWSVWVDGDYMFGNIDRCISNAIDDCHVFVILLSKAYQEKINHSTNEFFARDNCYKEFNYAISKNKPIITIVVDESMKNVSNWTGIFSMRMYGFIFLDGTTDSFVSSFSFTLAQYNITPTTRKRRTIRDITRRIYRNGRMIIRI